MKIAFKTFGCKANSVDTDFLYLEAQRRGHQIVDEEAVADAYVINSCTVTQHADRDARVQTARYKRQNPDALVGVVGCYAQVAKDELLALPSVDYVVGTAEKIRILDHLEAGARGLAVARDQVSAPTGFLETTFRGSRYARASIKIQDGCNFKCSFCIIPAARGRSRSLPIANIVDQVATAYAQGFQEVILTGIHLAHYGWDLNTDLMALLRAIFAQPGPRVRLTTLDPFEIPDGLLELMAQEPRLCPHFHIALQSGSDLVLEKMRRFYKAQEFVDVVAKIKAIHPHAFVGVDVIVGFPGETDEEFQKTVDVLEASDWSKLHVFSFSLRRGTAAEALPDRVQERVISERSEQLRALSEVRYQKFLASQINRRYNVVLERPLASDPTVWTGHTENYLPTLCKIKEGTTKSVVPSIMTSLAKDKVWVLPV